jgi:hypothetical protein
MTKPRSPLKLTLAAGCLLIASAAAALAATPPSMAAPQPVAPDSPNQTIQQPAVDSDSARRIGAAEARQALAKGEAVLVDVRAKESYDAEHAKGALLIPLGEITSRAGSLPKDKLIITYCT